MRALALLAVVLAACGGSTLLDATKYPHSCSQGSDCFAVFSGDQCSVCACVNAAVSASVKDQFLRDAQAALNNCGPRPAIACGACPETVTVCESGTCGVRLTDGGTP